MFVPFATMIAIRHRHSRHSIEVGDVLEDEDEGEAERVEREDEQRVEQRLRLLVGEEWRSWWRMARTFAIRQLLVVGHMCERVGVGLFFWPWGLGETAC